MNNRSFRIVLAGLLTTAMVLAPAVGIAQEKARTPPGTNAPARPSRGDRAFPFHGAVTAIDKSAMTLTVGERVFHVNADTKISKNGKPVTLADASMGDIVSGNYARSDDGKLTARTIRLAQKTESGEKSPKKEKSDQKK